MEESKFDVFLSHDNVDKEWVIKLKNDLLCYGISAWLDKDEIRGGDHIPGAVEEGFNNCPTVAVIVTPEARASEWVEKEYDLALTSHKKIIPVILKDVPKLFNFMQIYRRVDFTDETAYDQNVWELAWGITGKKPDGIITLTIEDSEFVNRKEEFELFKRILNEQTKKNTLWLRAGGGMGKTELLKRFIKHCDSRPVSYVVADFKIKPFKLEDFLFLIWKQLHDLPEFEKYVNEKYPKEAVESAQLHEKITEILKSVKPGEYIQKWLMDALYRELRDRPKRLVMIFDAYNEADDFWKNWLSDAVLANFVSTKGVVIVIAAHEELSENMNWEPYCYHHDLCGIKDADAWHKCYESIPREKFDDFISQTNGSPKEMREKIRLEILG